MFRINLETPCIMRQLVRDLQIDIVIIPTEKYPLSNVGLQLKYQRYKKMLICLFIKKFKRLLVCSIGSRIKHKYQNSDLYRLMFLFPENWSNLTRLLTHIFPTPKCIFHFCCLLHSRFDRQIGSASGILTPNPPPPRAYATA